MTNVVAGAATDTGVVRSHNEDAVATWPESPHLETNGRLFALADGMGGHSHGEIASAEALATVFERYYAEPVTDVALALKQAFREANERLYREGAARGEDQMMGTTLVAGVIRGNLLMVANVGDSRAYLFRGLQSQQLTRDHSIVAEQVAAGILSDEEAQRSTNRNVITRALGHQPRVDVDVFDVPLLPGDVILLASDGLYHAFTAQEMAELVRESDPAEAAARLVELASERQSTDNASAVVVQFAHAAALARAGRGSDLFDTDQLPVTAGAASRGRGRILIAGLVTLILVVVAALAILVAMGYLILPVF
jgi:protein phosphatase